MQLPRTDLYLDLHDLSTKPVDTKILCLLKIGRKEHMESLANGHLFCHHLAHYQNPQFKDQPFYDEHECLIQVLQADRVQLKIKNETDGTSVDLNLATGTQLKVSALLHSPAFCLHTIHTAEWTHKEFPEEELPMFREFLQIPEEMEKFRNGDEEPYVWLPNDPNVFLQRVTDACVREKIGLTADLVRYVDLRTYHGTVPNERIGFIKQSRHQNEREYRIIFRGEHLPNPFSLNVGSLRDISQVMSLKYFKSAYEIQFK